jgi:hypothetical protein
LRTDISIEGFIKLNLFGKLRNVICISHLLRADVKCATM